MLRNVRKGLPFFFVLLFVFYITSVSFRRSVVTSHLMFIFLEKLENEVFCLYLHYFFLTGRACNCLLHACLFIQNQLLRVFFGLFPTPFPLLFCLETIETTLKHSCWRVKAPPSSLPLPNIYMGFANKKNTLNLVQFSPQAVLSFQRGLEQCHVCTLLCCTHQIFSSLCPNVMKTPDKKSNGRCQRMMLEK